MKLKKKYGQNFLINDKIVQLIYDNINPKSNETILEIGPGSGVLTKKLKSRGSKLIAIEIDKDFESDLKKLEDQNTKIIFDDFLKVDLNEYKGSYIIVGNLPYYITTPIIEKIIESNINVNDMIFMVQKEVANRFISFPGTKNYGYFTVFLQHYFNIKKIIDVTARDFMPKPNVDSTVIKLSRKEKVYVEDEKKYFSFLKCAFKFKRKKLKNNLQDYDWNIILNILKENHYSENIRAEELPEKVFLEIYNKLL